MSDVAALDKHACPACGADGATGTPRSRRWSARTAAPSRRRSSPPTAASSRSTTSSPRCARSRTRRRAGRRTASRCSARAARRSRCSSRAASRRAASSADRRSIVPQSAARSPIVPESVLPFVVAETQVREELRALVRQPLVRAEPAEDRRAHRHGARPLHPLLDVRRAGRGALDGGSRPLLLRDRAARRARPSRSARCAGSRPPARSITSSTTSWCRRRRASPADLLQQGRAVPDASRWSRTTPATCPAGWSSSTRSTSSPPPSTRARAWTASVRAAVLGRRCRATRSATCRSTPTTRSRPSSTSSCRCGCVAYNYGSRTFQVLVNGQTGRIAGKHPYSWVKIAFAILAALIVLMIIAYLQDKSRAASPLRGHPGRSVPRARLDSVVRDRVTREP